MHPRGGRGVRVERKSWGLASYRVRHPIVVPLPLRHTRGRSSSERNTLSKTLRFVIDPVTQPRRFEKSNSQVEAGFSDRQPLCRHGVQIPLAQQQIVLAADFYQTRRRPIATVAGIKIPALLFRSPGSPSVDTRTRSCNIRIGSVSGSDMPWPHSGSRLARRTSARIISRKVTKPAAAAPATARRSVRRSPRALKTVDLALSN